jgi:fructokinase
MGRPDIRIACHRPQQDLIALTSRMSEMQRPHIVGIGELLWDKLPTGARLGGAVANFAVMSARLGNHSSLVSSIGDDSFGKAAMDLLSQPNLDLSQLQISTPHPTGTVEVSFSSGNQPSYAISTGVAWDFIRLTSQLLQHASTADALCFGTLAQRHEVSRATIQSLVESAFPHCVRVCDVNLRMPFCTPEILAWSMAHATVIKVSDEELPMVFSLLQIEVSTNLSRAADLLLDYFPQCAMVAMTLGPHGCRLSTRGATGEHPGFPIKLVDTVGAGDAFTAGLVHAYLRGSSLKEIAEIGNLCGSFVASQSGATPPLPPQLIQHIAGLLEKDSARRQPPLNKR